MRLASRVIGIAGIGAVLACADLKDIFSLQRGLAQEFHTNAINVTLSNSSYLTILFTNSPSAALPDSERAVFARRVAEFVRDHYPKYEQLTSIDVGFAAVHGAAGISFSKTDVPYRFTPAQLGPPKQPKTDLVPKAG
jgi:hypothetical protein